MVKNPDNIGYVLNNESNPGNTTILEAYQSALKILTTAKISSARLEALVLLCFVLDCDKTYIYTHNHDTFSKDKLSLFNDLISKRASHIPLQYLTGFAEFMSLKFHVNPNVLIPRQDTETLVEAVLDKYKNFNGTVEILDIGTGSGCIAISLARYIANCHITAVDISQKALETAQLNADLNKVACKISFIKSNIFSNIGLKKFHIIVSNPPYIPTKDIEMLMPEVQKYEPLNALDGGNDGLDFYKKIIEYAPKYLLHKGIIAFEAGIYQARDIQSLLEKDFKNISIKQDLSKTDRVIIANLVD